MLSFRQVAISWMACAEFSPSEVLIEQGSKGSCMYIVQYGDLDLVDGSTGVGVQ